MKILISGAYDLVECYSYTGFVGVLLDPFHTPDKIWLNAYNFTYACDNMAFSNWDCDRYLNMLKLLSKGQYKPLWVTVPDVVGNYVQTIREFGIWIKILNQFQLPAAFVLQDGCTKDKVPWDSITAVFVGGSTEYKLGIAAKECVIAAKERGKLAHMGRVNSRKRIAYAAEIGCDTVDGTGFSNFGWRDLPTCLKFMVNQMQY